MSTVILVGYAVAVVLLTVCIFRRPRQPSLDARIAAARKRTSRAPVVDTEHGTNLADHDECELLYSMAAYSGPDLDAGLDRLRAAIRDEQQNGDQT